MQDAHNDPNRKSSGTNDATTSANAAAAAGEMTSDAAEATATATTQQQQTQSSSVSPSSSRRADRMARKAKQVMQQEERATRSAQSDEQEDVGSAALAVVTPRATDDTAASATTTATAQGDAQAGTTTTAKTTTARQARLARKMRQVNDQAEGRKRSEATTATTTSSERQPANNGDNFAIDPYTEGLDAPGDALAVTATTTATTTTQPNEAPGDSLAAASAAVTVSPSTPYSERLNRKMEQTTGALQDSNTATTQQQESSGSDDSLAVDGAGAAAVAATTAAAMSSSSSSSTQYSERVKRKMGQAAASASAKDTNDASASSFKVGVVPLPTSTNGGDGMEEEEKVEEEASPNNNDEDEISPGAFSAPGRAPFAPRRRTLPSSSNDNDSNVEKSEELEMLEVVAHIVQQDELEETVRRQIMENTVQAEVIVPNEHHNDGNGSDKDARNRRNLLLVVIAIAVLGAVIGLSVGLTRNKNSDNSETESNMGGVLDTNTPTPSPTETPKPTLETVTRRGVLRCAVGDLFGYSVLNEETGDREGFDIDLCHAVAAAVLGDASKVEFVLTTFSERFVTFGNKSADLLNMGTTHTMERDIYQASAKVGFSFSVPYMYTGLGFSGVPPYGVCADNLKAFGECSGLKICVTVGSTHVDILSDLLPRSSIQVSPSSRVSFQFLINGTCNAIAGEQTDISEYSVRQAGYTGEFETGTHIFSKEPLAMVTRDDDPEWSDFVNMVMQTLLAAEEQGITQSTASSFTNTAVFGDEFANMSSNAVAAVGNYGEIYARYLEPIVPRQGLNLLNGDGSSTGLIYSLPFGSALNSGPGPTEGGTLERISNRGMLRCGITSRPGLGVFDLGAQEWRGLDADFCRAVSASVLAGTVNNVEFVELPGTGERFAALANGTVDVLSGSSVNIESDVSELTTRLGYSFSLPYFYDPLGEAFALATGQDDQQFSGFVYWTVIATFYAEEESITQSKANGMPSLNLFGGGYERMFRDVIVTEGNYGEMYARNVESVVPRSGRNLLNTIPFGPQHFVLPGI